MARPTGSQRSMVRLFSTYAAITLVPVLVRALVLAVTFRSDANQRGLQQGRSEATLIAQTAIEPQLDGRPLSAGISDRDLDTLRRLVNGAVRQGDVLRLRLRDLAGSVVFSDDGSGFGVKPDDEALEAARGEVVSHLTNLN